jgi:1-acyl-sn-glycerol-3-phosphate acyltransferase
MRPRKTIYYEDVLNDDFAGTKIKKRPLPKKFRYLHKDLVYFVISSALYYVVAVPILWVYAKIRWSFRIIGKKKIRKAHILNGGYFVYGNHTAIGDAMFAPSGIILPRRSYIVCSDDAVALPGLRWLVMMLGAFPLPDSPATTERFLDAISYRIKHGSAVLIFPEAHIWPYCTRIRPFPDQSFTYPAQLNAPVFALCTTYEEHRFFKFRKPRAVLHVSDPIYPDMSKPLGERAHALREAVYSYMVDISSSLDNVEYISYRPGKNAKKN